MCCPGTQPIRAGTFATAFVVSSPAHVLAQILEPLRGEGYYELMCIVGGVGIW